MKTETPLIPSWVHSLADYRRMFALDDADLALRLLDYPAGISSFNAEMHDLGYDITSADRNYDLSPLDMVKHVDKIIQGLAEHLDSYRDKLNGEAEQTENNILNAWNQYAQRFLNDYSLGKQHQRYQFAKLPNLPFADAQFDLALCSDLLFRSKHASPHEVICELSRVAHEVRIFPLLDEQGEVAASLGSVMLSLHQQNFGVEVREVPYKLLKGSNAMLRVWAKQCVVGS